MYNPAPTRLGIVAGRIYDVFGPHRRIVSLTLYAAAAAASFMLAYLLRFEFVLPTTHVGNFAAGVALAVIVRLGYARLFRLNHLRWRFVGTTDVLGLGAATLTGSLTLFVLGALLPVLDGTPRSVLLIDAVLHVNIVGSAWLVYRLTLERSRKKGAPLQHTRRALIIGAGESGAILAREMQRQRTVYRPVAFVDDDPLKQGVTMHGLEVAGTPLDLEDLTRRFAVDELIIAMPSADPTELRRLVSLCEETHLPFKVLPGIAEVLAGRVHLAQLRAVRIEDLLGRQPVQLELPELSNDLHDRSVLITGAAGSIGAELSRQVAMHHPGRLILFEQAETPLFFLVNELRERFPGLAIIPVVGDVVDANAVERACRDYQPQRIFHAAAYKHVTMMEENPRAAVINNAIGTLRVAEAAGRLGVEKFVLVSTDKAVRPTNIMGASKRLAELTVLELQERFPDTAYSAVRFGNVLDSAGSVIPIFRQQMAEGKPLTITHPDVTRYFMTIPEAVQLILQSLLLPELRGSVAMLDMGEPVRIVDLARNMLRLSGVASNGERIVYTGLRPGEKLHEELISSDEDAVGTRMSRVLLVSPRSPDELPRMLGTLPLWEQQLQRGGERTVFGEIHRLFPGCVFSVPIASTASDETPGARAV